MEQVAREIVKVSLFEAHSQQQETVQFLALIGRLAELLPLKHGVQRACRELTRIIIEETSFENCSILLWDAQKACLALAAADGLESLLEGGAAARYNQDLTFAPHEGVAGQAFASKAVRSLSRMPNSRPSLSSMAPWCGPVPWSASRCSKWACST